MYLARFSYDVLPINRQRALDFIRREVKAARKSGLNARLLVPLTRGHGDGAALQFEVELTELDQLDQFRNRGIGSSKGDRQLDARLQRSADQSAGGRDPARGRGEGSSKVGQPVAAAFRFSITP
jgi:hypothetical protein